MGIIRSRCSCLVLFHPQIVYKLVRFAYDSIGIAILILVSGLGRFLGIPQPSSMSYWMALATMTQECKPISSLSNTLPVLAADHY